MSEATVLLRIKGIGQGPDDESPMYATGKAFLVDETEGLPLEPEDIVEVSRDEALGFMSAMPNILEVVLEEGAEATRDLRNAGAQDVEPNKSDGLSAVVSAILGLDPDDESLWTSDGKPTVDALEEVLGYGVSADVRDRAWEIAQAA